jgi:glycine/D-amino acid oxidase-like deaminating enzyme
MLLYTGLEIPIRLRLSRRMTKHFDVAIVGGGIVGSATAYFLKQHGFGGSVAIIEKDTSFAYGCTARSVGGLRQQFSTPENIELSKFGLRIIRDLEAEFGPGADVGFKEQGYLMLASSQGVDVLKDNHALQKAHGADTALLTPEDLSARFPWLVTDGLALGCLGLSGEGWLDPYSFMNLFRKAAVARGVALISGEVAVVAVCNGRVAGLTLKDGTAMTCGALVNAAGAGAGAIAALAGVEYPVGPRKRYVYVVDCQQADESLHKAPLLVDPSGFYVRPEGRNFICGLSPEDADEPRDMDWDVDYGWFEERIWPNLAARIPTFEAIKVISAWVGHYDYNAFDQNGIIGPHPEIGNLYFANGFSGHGLQQGPASGNAIAELIAFGEYRTIDLKRFGFERLLRQEPLFEKNII